MENAAVGAVRVTRDMLSASGPAKPDASGKGVLIVVGGGNNGGDGLAVARGLGKCGVKAEVLLVKEEEKLRGDAATNLRFLRDENPAAPFHSLPAGADLNALLADRPLVIDAILGTGFHGRLSPEVAAIVQAMNRCGAAILALDIPSGLDSDSGKATDGAIRAARTVTFAAVKRGLVTEDGPRYTGEVCVAGIGTPV
ncbi:MAG: NAD(P)H-hydrate epimerase [Planctomycetes bacterium]|nr:NAD(P)H-hydrate epimerase [Planctomycetota bacterium]